MALTATVWPMLMPGPKFVYVIPLGAIAANRTLNTESVPGSQPADIMATLPCAFPTWSRSFFKASVGSPWMSKLSTVLMPFSRYSGAIAGIRREGDVKTATSTFPSSSTDDTTGQSRPGFSGLRLTTPASSMSGAWRMHSMASFPTLP